ncbi:MAG: hypothetical protein HQK52_10705 [Oligoflexia bacterium]|nr:hypothetical protein [Oligoflexia bacterium]
MKKYLFLFVSITLFSSFAEASGDKHKITMPADQRVVYLASSPVDSTFISSSENKQLILWDSKTGRALKELHTGGDQYFLKEAAFSYDGRLLLTNSWDKKIKLWDMKTGKVIKTFSGQSEVGALAFSHDGNSFLAGHDSTGDVELWNIKSGKMERTIPGPKSDNQVVSTLVEFSPDDQAFLVSHSYLNSKEKYSFLEYMEDVFPSTYQQPITLYQKDSGEVLNQAKVYSDYGYAPRVAFSPEGDSFYSIFFGAGIKQWDSVTGEKMKKMIHSGGHPDLVTAMKISPDGRFVVVGKKDHSVEIWDVAKKKEVKRFSRKIITKDIKSPLSVLSADGQTLIAWDHQQKSINLYPTGLSDLQQQEKKSKTEKGPLKRLVERFMAKPGYTNLSATSCSSLTEE